MFDLPFKLRYPINIVGSAQHSVGPPPLPSRAMQILQVPESTDNGGDSSIDKVINDQRILVQVLQYLEEKKQLIRVALACRAFREAALDLVWASLDSLIPLLKLVPSTVLLSDAYVSSRCSTYRSWRSCVNVNFLGIPLCTRNT
jgi:hypothetical protein